MKVVTVYSTGAECQRCRLTMRKLDEVGIPYRVIDLTADPVGAARKHLTGHLGYTEAPVVTVGPGEAEHWAGYRPDLIEQLATGRRMR